MEIDLKNHIASNRESKYKKIIYISNIKLIYIYERKNKFFFYKIWCNKTCKRELVETLFQFPFNICPKNAFERAMYLIYFISSVKYICFKWINK